MANIVSLLVDDRVVDRNQGEIPKPAVIDLYSKAMTGVDRTDQLHDYYFVGCNSYI